MTYVPPLKSLFLGWIFSFLGWGLVAGLLGTAQVLDHQATIATALHEGVHEWLPWALFTPLLFCLTLRLPLDREHLAAALPTHLLLAAAALSGMHWWRSSSEQGGPPEMRRPPPPPPAWDQPPPPPPGPPNDGPPGAPEHRGPLFHLLRADLPIYLMILSAAHAALFFRREKERAASLAQARLEALRMQLQPHFLFNCLNTIAGLVHEEPDRAEELIVSLSELLRLTLSVSGEAELPLVREMEFVGRYMAIMHARFDGKLTFEVEFAPELKTALVPAFLLQPLVEEAVQNELQLNRAGGRVTLRASRDGEQLSLSVANGAGSASLTQAPCDGPGVQNARERLRQLYGPRASLMLDHSDGCRVEITLPFHTLSDS